MEKSQTVSRVKIQLTQCKYCHQPDFEHNISADFVLIPVQACVCGRDTSERGPGDEADLCVEMREEVIILVILVMDTDLQPQPDPRLPPGASSHGHEVAAKQEGVYDSFSLLVCPKSKK